MSTSASPAACPSPVTTPVQKEARPCFDPVVARLYIITVTMTCHTNGQDKKVPFLRGVPGRGRGSTMRGRWALRSVRLLSVGSLSRRPARGVSGGWPAGGHGRGGCGRVGGRSGSTGRAQWAAGSGRAGAASRRSQRSGGPSRSLGGRGGTGVVCWAWACPRPPCADCSYVWKQPASSPLTWPPLPVTALSCCPGRAQSHGRPWGAGRRRSALASASPGPSRGHVGSKPTSCLHGDLKQA